MGQMGAGTATWGTMSRSSEDADDTGSDEDHGGGMTSRQLLWLLARRWYLVVVGITLTLAILWPATHRPGVYWAQVNLVLLPPTSEYFPNVLEDPHYSLTALAGVVVTDFNGQHEPPLMASSETTLYGEGRTSGIEVRMPNAGNQWKPLYPTATIDLQSVGASPKIVTDGVADTTRRLNDLLAARQDELGIDPSVRVSLISSPADPVVYYVTGSRARALGAGAIVGIGLTIAGVYWFERLLQARRSRSRIGMSSKSNDQPDELSRADNPRVASSRPRTPTRRRPHVSAGSRE